METKPLVSIITVSYNTVNTIEQTILSVINQTYSNIEYIIIDGGSTDGTIEIIKKYADRISYWISEPDKGIYDAMNKGVLKATGDYVQYLNASDTIYKNTTIEDIVNHLLLKSVKSDVIYGDIIFKKEFGLFHLEPSDLNNFINAFPIYHPSSWVKKEVLKNNMFDTSFTIAADFKLFRDLYYKGYTFYNVPLIFTIFEAIEGISSTAVYKNWIENQKIIEKDKGFVWILNKYKLFLREKLKPFFYKLMNYIKPNYSKIHAQKCFLRDTKIKNIIQ